jgi:predicted RND superfamily exporter protein
MVSDAGVQVVDGRHEIRPPAEEAIPAQQSGIIAVYTGVVPIVYKAQRALLENLIQSSFWSFVTITPLMMLVCRSILGGAVVMLPNVLPVLVVFGGMGWLGVPIDIGSMMAASIALGVAVDDTIHYLTWYREGLNQFGDRRAAIISAYKRCAPPTLQAALISGLGLAVFAFSTFTPTQKLGWLMMTILLAGVVSELVMLPAILAGPLGRVFSIRKPAVPSPVPAPHLPQRKGELVSSRT